MEPPFTTIAAGTTPPAHGKADPLSTSFSEFASDSSRSRVVSTNDDDSPEISGVKPHHHHSRRISGSGAGSGCGSGSGAESTPLSLGGHALAGSSGGLFAVREAGP